MGVPTRAEMFVNPRVAIDGFLSGREVEGKEVDEYYLDFTPAAPFTERCVTPPGYEPHTTFGEFSFAGSIWPYVGPGWNGTAPSKPSEMSFDGQASGSLTGEIGEAWFDGSLKYLGYNGQELLSVGK